MIHKPGKKFSNKPFGNPDNPLALEKKSNKEIVTTEIWDKSLKQPWQFGDKHPYKLIMQWVVGNNYAITKVVDGQDNLVYYYCDISSPITEINGIFELHDWYLDIIKKPNEKAIVDDEDEFNEAVKLGYLSSEQIEIALKTKDQIIALLERNSVDF